uniref:PA domain-containing protein n=1 Tax=Hyaloperonospora arabidopsidis (strain Emoy2) TaxID=559515 RepID=M4BSY6_HYAAE
MVVSIQALMPVLVGMAAAFVSAKNPADPILSAIVNVKNLDAVFYASSATEEEWGASLEAQKLKNGERHAFYPLVYSATALGDEYGCTSKEKLFAANRSGNASTSSSLLTSTSAILPDEPFVLLVDRGGCTFTEKALHAQELGATVLIITDTLKELYNRLNVVGISKEGRQLEYSCSRGSGKVKSDAEMNDFASALWRGDAGVRSCADSSKCSSHMCIPSGGANKQVCCVWDIPDNMGFGTSDIVAGKSAVRDIVVVRLSIADGDSLKKMLTLSSEDKNDRLLISVYERDPPIIDPAQVIICILACATVLIGSYQGAAYERTKAQLKAALIAADVTSSDAIAQARVAFEEHDEQVPTKEQLDLSSRHALVFLVLGSGLLFLLFVVHAVIVVVVLFGIGAVFVTFQAIWEPLMRRLPIRHLHTLPWRDVNWQWEDVLVPAAWSINNLLALTVSFGIALFWFFTRFQSYSWVLQDVFGVCFCLIFLRTARVANLKVATVLLVLVFVYDVFTVIVSPYIFDENVMIKVATGGAQGAAVGGPLSGYCLRYPTDTKHDCRSESMPILLQVPKMLDWRAGFSLLGLGDIVLPGLLLVFGARYDYATRGQLFGRPVPLYGKMFDQRNGVSAATTGIDWDLDVSGVELGSAKKHYLSRRGLFCILMWGYATGILLANAGVATTGSDHPALMYLVPCTLGLLAVVAWRRGILKKLWEGPPELVPGYARRERSDNFAGGLNIDDATQLRGLGIEYAKSKIRNVALLQQHEGAADSPVSGVSYEISDDTPTGYAPMMPICAAANLDSK